MKYKFLPHTADVMFEAYGRSLEELFENAALATESTMVVLRSVDQKEGYKIKLKNKDLTMLLYDLLSELILIKDTENLLFSKFKIKIIKKKEYELLAECRGEKINSKKHKLLDDSKAITMHQFELKKLKYAYKCKVIVDV